MFRAIIYETSSTKECLIRMESLLSGEGRDICTVGERGGRGEERGGGDQRKERKREEKGNDGHVLAIKHLY